jgi:hypothetical protein
MGALGLVLALAVGVNLDLDVHAAYGAGARPAFGGNVSLTASSELWSMPAAEGALEFGLLAGYQVEPYALREAWLPLAEVTGANHRLALWFLVGHGFRLLESRRLILGIHLFGGWTQLWLRGRVVNETLGLDRPYIATAGRLTTGLGLTAGVRVTERLSVTARLLAPFPYALEVNTYVMLSLGVSFRF